MPRDIEEMALKIGTTSTLGIQRQLGKHTEQAATALERLSSGMRINRAADDAAGLAVSMSLQTDSRVFSQGMHNLNDGISRLTIAHSAVQSIKGILGRMQELATQAATGTINQSQRQNLKQRVPSASFGVKPHPRDYRDERRAAFCRTSPVDAAAGWV